MILIKAYHVIRMTLALNSIIYLLIKCLHKYLVCLTTGFRKDLISSFAYSLSFVSRHSLINYILSNCITRESNKLNIRNTLKVRLQLTLNKCRLSHSWNTDRHNNYDSFLSVATASNNFVNELHGLDLVLLFYNLRSILGYFIDFDFLLGLTLRSLALLPSSLSFFINYYLTTF
jgi:hypothetical protein